MKSVIAYYDELAGEYDRSRFSNSYGQFVDVQERQILTAWLRGVPPAGVVDLGCGTGRLLGFAGAGIDGSLRMLEEAARKNPGRNLMRADITCTPLPDKAMHTGLCFHVLMHLPQDTIRAFLVEAARIIRPGGRLILDIPAAPRRRLSRRPASGWHGDTALDLATLRAWAGGRWEVRRVCGVMMLSVHRIPRFLRPWLARIDAWLGRTVLGRYASYYVVDLERQA